MVINRLGGIKSIVEKNDSVAIKVNASFNTPPGVHTTDPRVVEALIRIINEDSDPNEILVVENAAARHMLDVIGIGATTRECFKSSGIEIAAKRVGAKLVALEEEPHEEVEVHRAKIYTRFMCPKILLDSDSLIYIPHMKTHLACGVTLSLKLSQGCIPTHEKMKHHRTDLDQKLVDMLHILKPKLSIVDGIWAEQGQGPTSPYEEDIIKDMNILVVSKDPVAADAVSSASMGYDPFEISSIRIAHSEGLGMGDLNQIQIEGSQISELKRHFRRPICNLVGSFPNINVYMGGACVGCVALLRAYLDQLHVAGLLSSLSHELNIIVGYGAHIPRELKQPTLVIGDCAEKLRKAGIFIEGCPPLSKIFLSLLEVLGENLKIDLVSSFRSHNRLYHN